MADLVGTVRREEHEDGYSIWVLVHRALCEGFGSSQSVWRNPEWLCIESSAVGNCGERLPSDDDFGDRAPVIGTVPGTEADVERREIAREVREDRTRDAAGLE